MRVYIRWHCLACVVFEESYSPFSSTKADWAVATLSFLKTILINKTLEGEEGNSGRSQYYLCLCQRRALGIFSLHRTAASRFMVRSQRYVVCT